MVVIFRAGLPEMVTRLWTTAAVIVLSGVISACGSSTGAAPPLSASGLGSRNAVLYHYAYVHCAAQAKPAAIGGFGANGSQIYALSKGYPRAAIGRVKPRNREEWVIVKRGCAAGEVAAFVAARSTNLGAICRIQADWLPRHLEQCKASG